MLCATASGRPFFSVTQPREPADMGFRFVKLFMKLLNQKWSKMIELTRMNYFEKRLQKAPPMGEFSKLLSFCICFLVRRGGLEPPRLAAHAPQAYFQILKVIILAS